MSEDTKNPLGPAVCCFGPILGGLAANPASAFYGKRELFDGAANLEIRVNVISTAALLNAERERLAKLLESRLFRLDKDAAYNYAVSDAASLIRAEITK